MSRPPLEVADLIRSAGAAFIERNRQWISWKHIKVLLAIARCRTAALGGHLDECTRCGHRATISYNSCRNRHCPKCQTAARERWIAARQRELLPTRYVHVVFTLPHRLAPLALQNKKILYDLLFRASAETLLEVARDPRHLGAELGFFTVLHTWSQKLGLHPHVHCVIPAGGLSLDHTHWLKSRYQFFLPINVLRRVFRGKFVAGLQRAFQEGQLNFHGEMTLLAHPKTFAAWLRPLFRKDWVVYAKPPFGGPQYVLQYLGRYTHRVAISNHRLVSFVDGNVTFRWRDSAHNNEQKLLTLTVDEFLRCFLLHVLPKGFVRIRNFGFLANRRRATLLPLCFHLLGSPQQTKQELSTANDANNPRLCPKCGGPMMVIERLTAAEIQLRSPPTLVTAAA
ncbi:MAG TPA: IS91 family transposase [Candidatus Dormibacteraeota bacterium]|nr:IS91 family transposase [Candidatus Dormibacteraeota bacterium]